LPVSIPHTERLRQLDQLLVDTPWLWRAPPFKVARPAWCERLPELTAALLVLDDATLAAMAADDAVRCEFLRSYLPIVDRLAELTELPRVADTEPFDAGRHFGWEIPGRKWTQITAFAAALGPVHAPLLEWCGGKGHLGRLLALQWQQPVVTLELNEELCHEGERLAQRAHVAQQFRQGDALSRDSAQLITGHHTVALHACGELHRTLLREAAARHAPAIDFAPCCYAKWASDYYTPFTSITSLQLSHDDLRLAITETVTSAPREVRKRDQEMAWKLGFDALRRSVTGNDSYVPIRPIDKGWLKLGFAGFCRALAQRDGVTLPEDANWESYEAQGWQRQHDSQRLTQVRHAFRRAIELWLVLDMAVFLETHGYQVKIATFCERATTPRNILISARLS